MERVKKMNSPLTNVVIYADHNNFSDGRSGYGIQKITVHHCAGVMSAESIGYLWQNPNRECSSHYGIGMDGRIGQYVDEYDTAWTDSNWESNCTSVTIETSNCDVGGDWPVSDASLESLIKLCADISMRNGLGLLVPGQNLTWHSMYAATTCPGDYLRARMQYIADRANEIISGGQPTPTPTGKIAVDGLWGVETTRKAQQVFGTPVDGVVSKQVSWVGNQNPGLLSSSFEWLDSMQGGSLLIASIQRMLGVNDDGYIGSDTISAMQRWLGTPVDGCVSYPSVMVRAFQHWLNER
jgi:hypothetical protein